MKRKYIDMSYIYYIVILSEDTDNTPIQLPKFMKQYWKELPQHLYSVPLRNQCHSKIFEKALEQFQIKLDENLIQICCYAQDIIDVTYFFREITKEFDDIFCYIEYIFMDYNSTQYFHEEYKEGRVVADDNNVRYKDKLLEYINVCEPV